MTVVRITCSNCDYTFDAQLDSSSTLVLSRCPNCGHRNQEQANVQIDHSRRGVHKKFC